MTGLEQQQQQTPNKINKNDFESYLVERGITFKSKLRGAAFSQTFFFSYTFPTVESFRAWSPHLAHNQGQVS